VTAAAKLYASIAGLVLVVGALLAMRAHERQIGALEERNAGLLERNRALSVFIVKDEQLLAHKDTVKVFRQVAIVDTVLQHIIDSAIVHHHDTVTVTREVLVEAKAALDSTAGVATVCCQLARDWKAKWATTDSLYKNVLKLQPSAWAPHLGVGVAAGLNPQGKFDAVAGLTLNWKIP